MVISAYPGHLRMIESQLCVEYDASASSSLYVFCCCFFLSGTQPYYSVSNIHTDWV